ncbi:DUF4097 family beta strand repeat-containing protein [Clostridium brassicae]|uniref:DUF4097 family beta strand repeat-containing protein n=1 Tax=Clostridium brassicae TaxID=2999072 RepID=A0ABT4D9E3_9CLOT|nr:DUF4097 family beta strand repeat-containing protein [Clostridium brassicae]MCY6957649.1 DUF4097 family beta strand repeat-containing protein [Clostridium brassicae]
MKIRSNKKIIIIVIGVIVIMSALGLGRLNMMREINEEESVSMNEINSIQVDMTSVDVHFIRNETSNEVKADFHGKAMQEIKLISKTDNKTLFLTVQRKYENLPLYEDVVLDVYIPKAYTKNLLIKMLSGAVKMDSFNLANFALDTSSGKLEAEKVNAKEISITSSSGGINIKSIDTENFKMVGKSSTINIDEYTAKKAEIETSSGSINLKNSIGDFNLKSNSGKVLVDYKNFEDHNVNIETSSGSVTLELPDTAEFLIEAKTSSGNFKSDFPIKITDKKDINGQIGTKNNKVMLKTSSGSIKILKK